MSYFHDFFSRFTGTVRAIVAFILPIAESHAGQFLAAALPIAEGIVTQLATSGMPSDQKRSEAVSQLEAELVKQGLGAAGELATSTLNLAVEMAVNKQKVK